MDNVVVSNTTVLIRDDHPVFIKLVEEFLQWAESPESAGHSLKPSAWFIGLLNKWVDEDRRVPVIYLFEPGAGKHVLE